MANQSPDQISDLPKIEHEIFDPLLGTFLDLPQAKFIENQLMNGVSQLKAKFMEPKFQNINGVPQFMNWEEKVDYHFKLTFSPNKKVLRLELYDTLLFPVLLEQILENEYSLVMSGEDVEFATTKISQNGWLGWAHFIKS